MKIFKLICKDFGHKFSFNAKDLEEAKSKMMGWLEYHDMLRSKSDFSVEETTDPKWIENSYVN